MPRCMYVCMYIQIYSSLNTYTHNCLYPSPYVYRVVCVGVCPLTAGRPAAMGYTQAQWDKTAVGLSQCCAASRETHTHT